MRENEEHPRVRSKLRKSEVGIRFVWLLDDDRRDSRVSIRFIVYPEDLDVGVDRPVGPLDFDEVFFFVVVEKVLERRRRGRKSEESEGDLMISKKKKKLDQSPEKKGKREENERTWRDERLTVDAELFSFRNEPILEYPSVQEQPESGKSFKHTRRGREEGLARARFETGSSADDVRRRKTNLVDSSRLRPHQLLITFPLLANERRRSLSSSSGRWRWNRGSRKGEERSLLGDVEDLNLRRKGTVSALKSTKKAIYIEDRLTAGDESNEEAPKRSSRAEAAKPSSTEVETDLVDADVGSRGFCWGGEGYPEL